MTTPLTLTPADMFRTSKSQDLRGRIAAVPGHELGSVSKSPLGRAEGGGSTSEVGVFGVDLWIESVP